MAFNTSEEVLVGVSDITQKIHDSMLPDGSFHVEVKVRTVTTVKEYRGGNSASYGSLQSSHNLTGRTVTATQGGITFRKYFADISGTETIVDKRRVNEAGGWTATVTTKVLTPVVFVDGVEQ